MLKYDPIHLASSDKKSTIYFRNLRWNGKRKCPRCKFRLLYYPKNRYGCKRCRYNFSEFTGTYLEHTRLPSCTIIHLLYLFTLGVPAYRIRFYVHCSLSTIERTFRLFRQSIYDESLQQLHQLRLSGEIEIDEALFGGYRKGGKRGWGSIEHKNLVFGIYKRNGIVITFPVSDRKHETLIPLIEQ